MSFDPLLLGAFVIASVAVILVLARVTNRRTEAKVAGFDHSCSCGRKAFRWRG